jgi:5-formyltetrahydrofolate cyclo-ligase
MTSAGTIGAAKRELRTRAKHLRAALDARQCEAWSAGISQRLLALDSVTGSASVFVYVATPGEVATRGIIDQLCAAGCRVAIPCIAERARMVAREFTGWDALLPGPLGILGPPCSARVVESVDTVIAPGLAFTTRGERLGSGAGYYDRWFVEHRHGQRIALAFEAQIFESLPCSERDVPVDLIVTEQRVIDPSANQR